MGRKVFISSDMSTDPELDAVAETRPDLALLWPWFLTAFDDWGRAEANARRLKLKVFPMISTITAETLAEAIAAFADAGLIDWYVVHDHDYMAIPPEKWFRYQTHIHKSKRDKDESRIPAPELGQSRTIAEPRGDERASAEERGIGTQNVPSPSLSPSLDDDDHVRVRTLERAWFDTMGAPLNPYQLQKLDDYLDDPTVPLPLDVVCDAMAKAAEYGHRNEWGYFTGILDKRRTRGLTTLERVMEWDQEWKQRKAQRDRASPDSARASPGYKTIEQLEREGRLAH